MGEAPDEMVERVPWMSPIHYEVLGFYEDHDIIINPSSLAVNIGYNSAQYVSDTCSELEAAGLLERSNGPKFSLSDRGRKFLDGDVDPEDINDPTT